MFGIEVEQDGEAAEFSRLLAGAPDWPSPEEIIDQIVAEGVPQAAPSGWTALELDTGTDDPGPLTDGAVLDAIVGFDRIVSWAGARQTRLLAEFARRRPGDDRESVWSDRASQISRWAPDEVGLALSISRMTAGARLAQARCLVEVLPATLAAFETGRIDAVKVRAICDATTYLSPEAAGWVQDRVLPAAPTQSRAQLVAALARAVIAVDPEGANDRHKEARKDRRVVVGQENEGMASLWALLAAPDALAAHQWLTRLARGLGRGDPRSMDARRADLLVGLLTGELAIAHPDTSDEPGDETGDVTDQPDTDPCSGGGAGGGEHDAGEHDAGEHDGSEHDDAGEHDAAGEQDAGEHGGSEHGGEGAHSDTTGSDTTGSDTTGSDTTGSDTTGAAASSASTDPAGGCRACAAERARQARPRVRPVTPGKPLVHVVMAYSTLTGADHQPGELVGYGPIPAELAREIAADAVWKRLLTDPASGALLDHGRTTYRPPAALAEFVRARDVVCRSPLCRRRAIDCELDHTVPYPLGPTAEYNLTDGCVLHHHEKHAPGWSVTQHPDGRVEWTTPTGHTYASEPFDYRPDPAPPPAGPSTGPIGDRSHTQPRPEPPEPPTRPPFGAWWQAPEPDPGDDPPPF